MKKIILFSIQYRGKNPISKIPNYLANNELSDNKFSPMQVISTKYLIKVGKIYDLSLCLMKTSVFLWTPAFCNANEIFRNTTLKVKIQIVVTRKT